MYDTYVGIPETFQELCGWKPDEFSDLLGDVMDVLRKPRILRRAGIGTELQARRRRRQPFKYRPEERLFHFLVYLRQYTELRKFAAYYNLSFTACWTDFEWLRQELVVHPALVGEVEWPDVAARATTRAALVGCGALPAGFEQCAAIVDGTKDPAFKPSERTAQAADFSKNKGFGKTHLLVTDLFGKPIHVEAGLWGNRNDRGLWRLSDIYQRPDAFLTPEEDMLADGIFQSSLHCKTAKTAIIPSSSRQLKAAAPGDRAALRTHNRKQRHLRVVIEQTLGMIKQYKIVANKTRGRLETQGLYFVLCTQLTARAMRVRNAYPRGQKWLNQAGEYEEWERELGENLYVDPEDPDAY